MDIETIRLSSHHTFFIGVALDPIDGNVIGFGVLWAVLKPVPINSAWSKTYSLTLRSTLNDVRELSYTLKWSA